MYQFYIGIIRARSPITSRICKKNIDIRFTVCFLPEENNIVIWSRVSNVIIYWKGVHLKYLRIRNNTVNLLEIQGLYFTNLCVWISWIYVHVGDHNSQRKCTIGRRALSRQNKKSCHWFLFRLKTRVCEYLVFF